MRVPPLVVQADVPSLIYSKVLGIALSPLVFVEHGRSRLVAAAAVSSGEPVAAGLLRFGLHRTQVALQPQSFGSPLGSCGSIK